MNDNEREQLKLSIIKKIEEINQSIKYLEEVTQPIAPDVSLGRLTRMEAIGEKSVNEGALRQEKSTLIGLEDALRRIDSEDFGICVICKKEIPLTRLIRVPESKVCVNCKK